MKVKIIFIIFVCLLFTYSINYSQITKEGVPFSFNHDVTGTFEKKKMDKIDINRLLREDSAKTKDEAFRFGYGFDVSYNFQNSGTWYNFLDGSRLWRLEIFSEGAYSINLLYDRFWLPEGASFFVYSADKKMVLGAYTSQNNKKHKKFATGLIKGDDIVLEYYEPANVNQKGEISISRIVHAYRNLFHSIDKKLEKGLGFGESAACNNNVHCPEAADWQNEVKSVVMILLGSGDQLGTGLLINNIKGNYAPYVLTANHIQHGNMNTWLFWFNYESINCNNPVSDPTPQTLVGATLKASNSTSDFALIMLDDTPPVNYNVYYSGWSAINAEPTSTVGIHHPSGDIKKISYDYDPSISTSALGYVANPSESFWKVIWDDGVTEGGSSGSPLYDQEHKIVGQLYGGYSSCSYPSNSDWYGKFSTSWNNGSTSSDRLKDWLDPNNTGIVELNGLTGGMLSSGELPANATWSGTHTITGTVTVPSGVTLTVESGSQIKFIAGASLIVKGVLNATGVTFTSVSGSSAGSWGSLILDGSSATNSNLSNLTVQYGEGVQFINGANASISNSTISNCTRGIYIYNSHLEITNNTIINPTQDGIYCDASSHTISFASNTITKTSSNGQYHHYTGINATNPSYNHIFNNVISGYDAGLYILGGATANFMERGLVQPYPNNKLTDCNQGIACGWGASVIGNSFGSYNSIYGNSTRDLYAYNSSTITLGSDYFGGGNPVKVIGSSSSISHGTPLTYDPWTTPMIIAGGDNPSSKSAMLKQQSSDEDLGLRLEQEKKYADALTVYFNLLQSGKISQNILAGFARSGAETKNSSVIEYFENLRRSSSEYKEFALQLLAGLYLRKGEFDKSLAVYDDIAKAFPNTYAEKSAFFGKFYATLHGKKDLETSANILKTITAKYFDKETADDVFRAESILSSMLDVSSNPKSEKITTTITTNELLENYPNPFNPVTTISYNILQAGFVSLKIYDILGREVATLVSDYKPQGKYFAQFNANNLASGMYIYRLTSGTATLTKRMMLLK